MLLVIVFEIYEVSFSYPDIFLPLNKSINITTRAHPIYLELIQIDPCMIFWHNVMKLDLNIRLML